MNWRLIVPLTAVVIGLGLYIVVIDQKQLSSGELQSRTNTLLPSFVVMKVTRIEIAHRGNRLAFVRKDFNPATHDLGHWKMVHPKHASIDKQVIDALISELEWMEPSRRLEDISERDRAQFGLVHPRIRLAYWVQQRRHVLIVGKQEPRSLGYYAQTDDENVAYVVNAEFVARLTLQAADYLHKPDVSSDAGMLIQ